MSIRAWVSSFNFEILKNGLYRITAMGNGIQQYFLIQNLSLVWIGILIKGINDHVVGLASHI